MNAHSNKSVIDILLVEDNQGDVELTKIAFESAGVSARLAVAHDGVEAIDYLHKRGKFQDAVIPDLILLDINMPRMNGMEFLQTVKQDEQIKIIPVIMLTSSDAVKDIRAAYLGHANSYVIKPNGIEEGIDMAKHVENFWIKLARLPSLH